MQYILDGRRTAFFRFHRTHSQTHTDRVVGGECFLVIPEDPEIFIVREKVKWILAIMRTRHIYSQLFFGTLAFRLIAFYDVADGNLQLLSYLNPEPYTFQHTLFDEPNE